MSKFSDFSGCIYFSENDKIILKKSYGYKDYKSRKLNSFNTIFKIGSITKQFTAMCILLLVEKKMLRLEDSVSKFITNYPDGDKIYMHNLLSMTSGIPNYLNDLMYDTYSIEDNTYTYSNAINKEHSISALINFFKERPLNFPTSSKYEYSNSNYIILGHIIEVVSGMSYGEFLDKYIFKASNMNHSFFNTSKTFIDESIGYTHLVPCIEKSPEINNSILFSAGGISSTIIDLYSWTKYSLSHPIFRKYFLEKSSSQPTIENSQYAYLNGWVVDITSGNYFIGDHTGMVPGFTSYIYVNEKLKQTLIILSNNEDYYKEFPDFYTGMLYDI